MKKFDTTLAPGFRDVYHREWRILTIGTKVAAHVTEVYKELSFVSKEVAY